MQTIGCNKCRHRKESLTPHEIAEVFTVCTTAKPTMVSMDVAFDASKQTFCGICTAAVMTFRSGRKFLVLCMIKN